MVVTTRERGEKGGGRERAGTARATTTERNKEGTTDSGESGRQARGGETGAGGRGGRGARRTRRPRARGQRAKPGSRRAGRATGGRKGTGSGTRQRAKPRPSAAHRRGRAAPRDAAQPRRRAPAGARRDKRGRGVTRSSARARANSHVLCCTLQKLISRGWLQRLEMKFKERATSLERKRKRHWLNSNISLICLRIFMNRAKPANGFFRHRSCYPAPCLRN